MISGPRTGSLNFYDVHTGTSGSYIPKSGDITVDNNGDNSIETNDFNVQDTSQGGYCITIQVQPTVTTDAHGDITLGVNGSDLTDTATLSGAVPPINGTVYVHPVRRRELQPCDRHEQQADHGERQRHLGRDPRLQRGDVQVDRRLRRRSGRPLDDEWVRIHRRTSSSGRGHQPHDERGQAVHLDAVNGHDLRDVATLSESERRTRPAP